MKNIENYAEGFVTFVLEESELGRSYDKCTLESLAALQDGWLYTPKYDLKRFLARSLLEKSPGRYTVSRAVRTDNEVFADFSRIPVKIQLALVPPRERKNIHLRDGTHDDRYDDAVCKKMQVDIESVLESLLKQDVVVESCGYGIIEHCDYTVPRPYPLIVDAKPFQNQTKKQQLLTIIVPARKGLLLRQPHLEFAHPHLQSILPEKQFSSEQLVGEDIARLARSRYTAYDFETYGVRIP